MKTIIELKNISKKYDDTLVVKDLSLKIHKGEIFGFLGPNGAGKTTSINMMVGLLNPTKGEVILDENFSNSDIGICPQDIVLWDYLTCYENLYTMGSMYDINKNELNKRIESILNKLSLTNKRNSKIEDLSGGMKRRMNIAMATIHDPPILVLDEPSEGLDPQTRRILWDYIRFQKNKGNTIILTTHLMDEADILSDRIAIIDEGKLLKLDTPRNLKSSIGDGDVLKISVDSNVDNIMKSFENIDYIQQCYLKDSKIILNLLNATNKLPEIIKLIESKNSKIKDISIRQNTLEDVFIELTGKNLRE